jgi:hypothetical protein
MDDFIPFVAMLIPIIAIILGIGIAALAIILGYRKRKIMLELFHKERLAAIDKGMEPPPIPEELFSDSGKPPSPHGTLLAGLIFTLTGLGLLMALHRYHPESALYGLIPVGFGLAFLIYYFTVGRKEAAAYEARRNARLSEASRAAGVP